MNLKSVPVIFLTGMSLSTVVFTVLAVVLSGY
jgi:hypothetical protein